MNALSGLSIPLYWVEPEVARTIEIYVRKATKRPRPLYPWERQLPPRWMGHEPTIVDFSRLRTKYGPRVYRDEADVVGTSKKTFVLDPTPGDTLFGLAEYAYGDPFLYTWIIGANPHLKGGLQPDDQVPLGAPVVVPGSGR